MVRFISPISESDRVEKTGNSENENRKRKGPRFGRGGTHGVALRERREGRGRRGGRRVGVVVARQVHGVVDLHVVRQARVHEGSAADATGLGRARRGEGSRGGAHRLRQRRASSASSPSSASTSSVASAACSAPPSADAGGGARLGGRGASPPIILYLSVGGHVAPSRHAQNGVPSSSVSAATRRSSSTNVRTTN